MGLQPMIINQDLSQNQESDAQPTVPPMHPFSDGFFWHIFQFTLTISTVSNLNLMHWILCFNCHIFFHFWNFISFRSAMSFCIFSTHLLSISSLTCTSLNRVRIVVSRLFLLYFQHLEPPQVCFPAQLPLPILADGVLPPHTAGCLQWCIGLYLQKQFLK